MLDAHVLVLNRHYQAVHITSARRALCMMYIGAARAIDQQFHLFDFASWAALAADSGQDAAGAVSGRIRVPRVVVLQAYDRIPLGRIRFSRQNIFVRDDLTCQYCGKRLPRRNLNLDHVVPRSQGGKTNWGNVVASCVVCNVKKGGRTPEQARMELIREPRRPNWSEMLFPRPWRGGCREWLPFLNPVDASYWNTELESD